MLQVSRLFIYPIKSLAGIELHEAEVTDRGFKYDRRWMLVDNNGRFISQREHAQLALFKTAINVEGVRVSYKDQSIIIPFKPLTDTAINVTVWYDTCTGVLVDPMIDQWFSDALNMSCRLVYMPDSSQRHVSEKYARNNEITSFSDAYPFLLVGQASLNDLNEKLTVPVPIDRFRPNIVFTGGSAFQEDSMSHFTINNVHFYGVKPCARCVMINIDQQTTVKNNEPTKVLARYRLRKNNVYFGQNLIHSGEGKISVGDTINIAESGLI